jgi:pyroglutamyl-peptidase
MTLLLTGFETFGRFASNPSWDALLYAREEGLLPHDSALARIPVEYATAFPALQMAVDEHSPTAIISFGLHGGMSGRGADTIYIETTPRNRDGAGLADNAGEMRRGSEVVPGAPETLQATFPAQNLVQSLKAAGFDAQYSDDAGSYLCNHLFYRMVHTYGDRFPCGFVHVPPVEEIGGIMTLKNLAKAVSIIADTLSRTENTQ